MKTITIALGCVIVVGGLIFSLKSSTSYEAPTPEIIEIEKVEMVDPLDLRIKAAQEEAKATIEAEAKKVYEDAVTQGLLDIEIKVRKEDQAEKDAVIKEKEKQSDSYWRDQGVVASLIRQYFPEDPHTAVAIAKCESNLNPKAYNPKNTNGTTDGGLWQINDVHNGTLARMGLDKFHPEDATKFARYLYDQNGGFGDWVCYNKYLANR